MQKYSTQIAGFLCLMVIGVAQEVRAAEPNLEEVIVEATRIQQPATSIAGAVTIIDRETVQIQSQIADDLASVLSRTVPGFAPSSQKLAGRGETLRGRNPLYLIDGVPQHNALRDGQRDGHSLDLAFVERIEVISGSNAIQGIGATGGVVNTVTLSPKFNEDLQFDIGARLSSDDGFGDDAGSYKVQATAMGGNEQFALAAGVALHERGLFIDANGDPVGLYPTQGDIMDSSSENLFLKAAWQATDDIVLTLMLSDFNLERNGDFRSVNGDRTTGLATGTVEGSPAADVGDPASNEVTAFSATLQHNDFLGGTFTVQAFDQSYEALFEGGTFGDFFRLTPTGGPFLDQSAIVSEKNGLKSTYHRALDNGINITVGLDWFRDDSAQELAQSGRQWVPNTRFESLSPFAQIGWMVTPTVTLSAGARREYAGLDVDDYTTIAAANSTFVGGGDPDFEETLANVGVVWQFADDWRLYGSYSEGFTMPDVGRVLRGVSTPGQDVETLLNVEPVVTDNLEAGLEFDNGKLQARLTYFESEAENGSRLRTNSAGIFEVERQRTEIDGFEVVVDYLFSDNLGFGANYSSTDGRFDSDRNGSIDSDLDGLNIGPDRLNAHVYGSLWGAIDWRLQAYRFEDRDFDGINGPSAADFDGYTLADLALRWQANSGLWSFTVENLLNEDYFTYFAQVEPSQRSDTYFTGNGRTLSVGWQRQF